MKMKQIIIFGTGAVAAEITSYLEDSDWGEKAGIKIKGYVTSDKNGLEDWKMYKYKSPYLGSFEEYNLDVDDYFVIAFGNCEAKKKVVKQIYERGGRLITLIHPTAVIAHSAVIGEGNIIAPFVMIGPNVKLGNFNLLTSQSIISHDTQVGDYNFFATSLLCGHTCVGDGNYFGIHATTTPGIVIGNRNIIQAGMVLDKNIGDDTTVFYRYKEKVLAIPKNE